MPAGVFTSTEEPVRFIPTDAQKAGPKPGIGLCLSGGGYRAMLFHVGSLWRLHEIGLLNKLKRISSVSGGSIIAAYLGLQWGKLYGNPSPGFEVTIANPIRSLANRTIDAGAVLGGILLPGSISDKVADAYRKHLFGDATLQDLPDDPAPCFVINATNVQTNALWRFSKPYMADYRVGIFDRPRVSLATAVAASSAFPPILSPVELHMDPSQVRLVEGNDLHEEPYISTAVLSDGGVYDNLGLETVWKEYQTILVSDAGAKAEPEPDPKRDWGRHAYRILNVIDNQVRSLRKRQLIEAYQNRTSGHDGAYWGIASHFDDYPTKSNLSCPPDRTLALAKTPTRLKQLAPQDQERLINWGYAVCDAAIRSHVDPKTPAAPGFPYPGSAV